jgi:hypothetical protein
MFDKSGIYEVFKSTILCMTSPQHSPSPLTARKNSFSNISSKVAQGGGGLKMKNPFSEDPISQ